MIIRWSCKRFDFGISFNIRGKVDVYGYTNRCDDGKMIIFLDYDNIPLEWIIKELKFLQDCYELGNFYIMGSSDNSFHAVCFSKVNLLELNMVLLNSSVDINYHRIPFTIGKKLLTLRLTSKGKKKPKFLSKVKHECNRLESLDHKQLFNKFFDCMTKEEMDSNNDNKRTEMIFSHYKV